MKHRLKSGIIVSRLGESSVESDKCSGNLPAEVLKRKEQITIAAENKFLEILLGMQETWEIKLIGKNIIMI